MRQCLCPHKAAAHPALGSRIAQARCASAHRWSRCQAACRRPWKQTSARASRCSFPRCRWRCRSPSDADSRCTRAARRARCRPNHAGRKCSRCNRARRRLQTSPRAAQHRYAAAHRGSSSLHARPATALQARMKHCSRRAACPSRLQRRPPPSVSQGVGALHHAAGATLPLQPPPACQTTARGCPCR